MANETDKKEDVQKLQAEAKTVAEISIPTIIGALHQNALKNSNAQSKGARLTNSAIDDKDGKAKIKAAGEHLISVMPIDANKPLEKKTAIDILKTYVQWFVGPDLAKKVDSLTVKSLKEAPGNEQENKAEESKKDTTKDKNKTNKPKSGDSFEDSESLDESLHKFMSFKRFLNEAKEAEEKNDFQSGEDLDENPENEKKSDDSFDNSEDLDDDKENNKIEDDESKQSQLGYYIPYNLKIEGLPQTALKDAMKKFALTFFDDVKITASGLFGGGDSFTIKDVKEKFRDAFGPIDPDDLVANVQKEIDQIKHPNSDPVEVKVRDKKTLLSDIGKQADAAQRKMIDSANYSLWIKLTEFDPKKAIFNTRVIADIVTSSIKGLYKKFKNKITKNDVVYIENYRDQHDDTKALERLNQTVPEPSEFTGFMRSERASISYVWSQIDKAMDTISKDKQFKNSFLAQECYIVWKKFKTKHENDPERTSTDKPGKAAIEKYFKKFMDDYTKVFDENKHQQNLHESSVDSILKDIVKKSFFINSSINNKFVKNDLMSMLFESFEQINEDELHESKLTDYIDKNNLTKEEALKPEMIKKFTDKNGLNLTHDSKEKIKAAIEQHFAKKDKTEEENREENKGDSTENKEKMTNDTDVDHSSKYEDLYIVPLPGLRYKDKEYNTYA